MASPAFLPLALIQLEVPLADVVARIGEQPRWFIEVLGLQPEEYLIVCPHLGESLPQFDQISGAIISGSWAMVTDHADWSERCAAWVRAPVQRLAFPSPVGDRAAGAGAGGIGERPLSEPALFATGAVGAMSLSCC
nr:EamA family transporter [Candidatus Pantoea persica]